MFNEKVLTKFSRVLIYAIAVMPFVVWTGISFPYVTIRTIFFRILIEIASVAVLAILIQGRHGLAGLKRNYFFWILSGLLIVEIIASAFGESFLTSMFGDLERMWGVFTFLHLFIFYLLLRAVFAERQWHVFFQATLIVSFLVSVYGIIQRSPEFFNLYLAQAGVGRIPSTLGNPAYVAIYLLFCMALALYCLAQKPSNKLKIFYWASLIINFYAFTLTDIRGAYLGMLSAVGLAVILYLFLGSRQRVKIIGLTLILVTAIGIVAAIQFKRSPVVQKIPIIKRLAGITLSDETVQTRFIGWNAAWAGWLEHPLLGVGPENYNVLFNQYFPARYYNLAASETYFDRAHNQFLNILAESGIFAFLFYLAIPVVMAYYLIAGYRREKFALAEFLILSGMSLAYYVHVFFIFDELNSYIYFVVLLAFIEHKFRGRSLKEKKEEQMPVKRPGRILARLGLVGAAGLVLYSIFALNVNVLLAAKHSATAYLSETFAGPIIYYRRSLSPSLILKKNIVINYGTYLVALAEKTDAIRLEPDKLSLAISAIDEVKGLLQDEIKKKPNDAFFYLQLGQLNNTQYLLDDNIAHLQDSIIYLRQAIDLSPERLQIYYILGETLVLADQSKPAIDVLEKAVELNPNFGASYYYLGRAYLADEQLPKAFDFIINKSLLVNFYNPIDKRIMTFLAEAEAEAKAFDKVVIVYENMVRLEPKNAGFTAALATAYVQADQYDKAIAAAQKAAELDSSFASEAQYFIELITSGRIDELKRQIL